MKLLKNVLLLSRKEHKAKHDFQGSLKIICAKLDQSNNELARLRKEIELKEKQIEFCNIILHKTERRKK